MCVPRPSPFFPNKHPLIPAHSTSHHHSCCSRGGVLPDRSGVQHTVQPRKPLATASSKSVTLQSRMLQISHLAQGEQKCRVFACNTLPLLSLIHPLPSLVFPMPDPGLFDLKVNVTISLCTRWRQTVKHRVRTSHTPFTSALSLGRD